MQRLGALLTWCLVVAALGLAVAGTAWASGSASGSQYTDPLANPTPSSSSSPGSSSSSQGSGSSSSQGSGSSSPQGSGSSSSQASGSSASSTGSSVSSSGSGGSTSRGSTGSSSSSSGQSTATSGSGRTLPFTGLNVWACLSVGFGLMGTGLLLRYALRRAW